jgi:predicted RNA-binding Zn-ribbon protein involved in translation (DUF1610 family)
MTTIKATCPSCGEVGLTPDEIELRVDQSGDGSFYAFTCPACLEVVRKPADDRIVRLLSSGGVQALDLGQPFGPRPGGPRFTHDDLLDFHTLLETSDWFTGLEALVRSGRV